MKSQNPFSYYLPTNLFSPKYHQHPLISVVMNEQLSISSYENSSNNCLIITNHEITFILPAYPLLEERQDVRIGDVSDQGLVGWALTHETACACGMREGLLG